MYTQPQIEIVLSKQAKALFTSDPSLFTSFEPSAAEIAANYVDDPLAPPDWVKQPFAWILEYIVNSQLSGQTPEYMQMVQTHYKEAIKLLEDNSATTTALGSKAVAYVDLYSSEE